MKRRASIRTFVVCAALGLPGGCGPAIDHPSLAPRAIEQFDAAAPSPPPPPPAPIAADASRLERIEALLKQARDGNARFVEQLPSARASIERASGGAAGSESWVSAEQALSRIDTLRTTVAESLADLNALQLATPAGGTAEISVDDGLAQAIAEVSAIDDTQRAAIAAMQGKLSAF